MPQQRTALNWDRFFALFGRTPEPVQPPAPPAPPAPRPRPVMTPGMFAPKLEEVFQLLTKKVWEDAVLPLESLIHQEIREEAKRQGVEAHVFYIYYLLFERSAQWPSMPSADARTLRFLKTVISKAATVPNYSGRMSVPEWDDETKIDATLKALAVWGRTKLKAAMIPAYLRVIQRYAPSASTWLNFQKTDPEAVREAFEAQVLDDPALLGVHGRDLWFAVSVMRS